MQQQQKKKWNMQIKCVPKLKSFWLWNLGSVLHHLTENAVLEKAEEKKKKRKTFHYALMFSTLWFRRIYGVANNQSWEPFYEMF